MIFHHLGIACKDLNHTLEFIKKTHKIKSISDIVFDEKQNASLCMVEVESGLKVELISGKQVEKFIKKNIANYHICYKVDDIKATLDDYVTKGAIVISGPKPAVLFGYKKIAFVFTPMGIIEFVESPNFS